MILTTEGRGVVLRPNGLKSTNKTFLFYYAGDSYTVVVLCCIVIQYNRSPQAIGCDRRRQLYRGSLVLYCDTIQQKSTGYRVCTQETAIPW